MEAEQPNAPVPCYCEILREAHRQRGRQTDCGMLVGRQESRVIFVSSISLAYLHARTLGKDASGVRGSKRVLKTPAV